jgi:ABC-type multidrug transport system permease subunit
MVFASASCYAVALILPAYYESAPAIDAYRTFSSIECLLAPVIIAPFVALWPSWWANPIYAFGLLALSRKWDALATAAGVVSGLLALLFAAGVYDPYNQHLHMGYWAWLASMAMVGAGGLVGLLTRNLASQASTEESDVAVWPPAVSLDVSRLPKYPR